MTMRYAHLSHEYQLGVVDLLDEPSDTTTDTGHLRTLPEEIAHVN